MKPTLITPKADAILSKYDARINELHKYLRPDGLNAVIEPAKKAKPQSPIVTQHAYFKPTESILESTKREGIGEIIDFRFG